MTEKKGAGDLTLQVLEFMAEALRAGAGAGKTETKLLTEVDGLGRCLERSVELYERGMVCEAIDLLGDVCFRKYEDGLEKAFREGVSRERALVIGKRIALLAEWMHKGVEPSHLRQELSIIIFAVRISAMQAAFSEQQQK